MYLHIPIRINYMTAVLALENFSEKQWILFSCDEARQVELSKLFLFVFLQTSTDPSCNVFSASPICDR